MVEMKKAVESDMDLRDDNVNDNMAQLTQIKMHRNGMRNVGVHLSNLTRNLLKLYTIEHADKTMSEECAAQYDHIEKGIEQLQKWNKRCILKENQAAAVQVEQPLAGSDPAVEEG